MSYKDVADGFSLGVRRELLTATGVTAIRPVWNPGELVCMRALPSVDDEGNIEPWRVSKEQFGFGGWIENIIVARRIGVTEKVSFNIIPKDGAFSDYKSKRTPYQRLLTALNYEIRTNELGKKQAWEPLVDWKIAGGSPPAPLPEPRAVIQGIVVHRGATRMSESPLMGAVFALPKTASKDLEAMLEEPVVPAKDNEEDRDYESSYKYGAVVNPTKGLWIIVERASSAMVKFPRFGIDKHPLIEAAQTGGNLNRYSCYLVSRFDKDIDDPAVQEDIIRQTWQPWSSVLLQLTEKEQIELMASVFSPDIITAAFGNDYISDEEVAAASPSKIVGKGAVFGKSAPVEPALTTVEDITDSSLKEKRDSVRARLEEALTDAQDN